LLSILYVILQLNFLICSALLNAHDVCRRLEDAAELTTVISRLPKLNNLNCDKNPFTKTPLQPLQLSIQCTKLCMLNDRAVDRVTVTRTADALKRAQLVEEIAAIAMAEYCRVVEVEKLKLKQQLAASTRHNVELQTAFDAFCAHAQAQLGEYNDFTISAVNTMYRVAVVVYVHFIE
jgi:hypothetical protein